MNIDSYKTDKFTLTLTCSLAINWHVDYLNGLLDAKPPKTSETEAALQTAIKCKQLFGDECPHPHHLKRCALDYPHHFLVPLLAALDAWKKVLKDKKTFAGLDVQQHINNPYLFEIPLPETEDVKTLLFVNAARVWVRGIYMNSLNGDEQQTSTAADQHGTETVEGASVEQVKRRSAMFTFFDECFDSANDEEKGFYQKGNPGRPKKDERSQRDYLIPLCKKYHSTENIKGVLDTFERCFRDYKTDKKSG